MYDSHDIEHLVERIDNLRRSHLREFAYSEGLHLRQLEALNYLTQCNRYSNTPLALSEYLNLTKGTVSQTLIALVDKGFLKKVVDKNDKRVVHLFLSAKAKRIVEKCRKESPISSYLNSKKGSKDARELGVVLKQTLQEIQHANDSLTFGVCHTCKHFLRFGLDTTHQCGLTKEPLEEKESLQICREHSRL